MPAILRLRPPNPTVRHGTDATAYTNHFTRYILLHSRPGHQALFLTVLTYVSNLGKAVEGQSATSGHWQPASRLLSLPPSLEHYAYAHGFKPYWASDVDYEAVSLPLEDQSSVILCF